MAVRPAGRRDGSPGPARRPACGRRDTALTACMIRRITNDVPARREQAPLMRRSRMARGAAERRRAGRDKRHRSRLRRARHAGEGRPETTRTRWNAGVWRVWRPEQWPAVGGRYSGGESDGAPAPQAKPTSTLQQAGSNPTAIADRLTGGRVCRRAWRRQRKKQDASHGRAGQRRGRRTRGSRLRSDAAGSGVQRRSPVSPLIAGRSRSAA